MAFDAASVLENQFNLNNAQQERMFAYVRAVTRAPMNLTAWNEEQIWMRGVFDALLLSPQFSADTVGRALDIGTGGGFPGMVLAIAHPEWTWVLLDSRIRRIQFLENTARELGLDNVTTVTARAEAWIYNEPEQREAFDVVAMRAVAPLRASLEMGLPYVCVTGVMLLAQGPQGQAELAREERFLTHLGGHAGGVVVQQPQERETAVIQKVKASPEEFPRSGKAIGRL